MIGWGNHNKTWINNNNKRVKPEDQPSDQATADKPSLERVVKHITTADSVHVIFIIDNSRSMEKYGFFLLFFFFFLKTNILIEQM